MNALLRILSLPAQLLSRIPGLGPLIRVCSTTVGQKILMAISGLALCGFLVAHLGGNLKLFAGEKAFNDYAHALHSLGPILAAAEVGLFATFVLHISLAVSTCAMNKVARRNEYFMKETKQGLFILPSGGASSWMMVTGLMIFGFLVVHILDMKLKIDPLVDYSPSFNAEKVPENEFQAVQAVLSNPINAAIYFSALIALGIHLSHGVRSALQTLGVSHKRWNVLLRLVCVIFAWAIALGFMSLVIWTLAFRA